MGAIPIAVQTAQAVRRPPKPGSTPRKPGSTPRKPAFCPRKVRS